MKFRNILNMLVCLLFLFSHPVWSQQSEQTVMQMKDVRSWNLHKLSDQDALITICSIQWGTPDRWSITSRYLHGFKKDRDNEKGPNGVFSITLSPGTAGGRLGIGYWDMYLGEDIFLPFEARGVLLRTWGHPLSTLPNRTFVGAEFRTGFMFFNLGIGYYTQIFGSNKDREQFYGFHFGVGI